jgi:alanyl-tRNA synthetase
LCGGTHTGRTGDVGLFKIVGESSVAAGVRRIEAVTGRAAVALVQKMEDRLREAADCFKASPEELVDRIQKLREEVKALKKGQKAGAEKSAGNDLFARVEEVSGVKVLVAEVEVSDPKDLRVLGDQVKDKLKSGVAVLGAKANGKAHLLAVVTPDLIKRIGAGDIVKESAPLVGGKGGGRPDFAQAGGPEPEKLEQALAAARRFIAARLG